MTKILFIGVGDAGSTVVDKLSEMHPVGMKFMKVCKKKSWLEYHNHGTGCDCPVVGLLDSEIVGLCPGTHTSLFAARTMLHADEIRELILKALRETTDAESN